MYACVLWDGNLHDLDAYARLLQEEYSDDRLTKEFMLWKHVQNPLGRSIIALAKNEGGKVVAGRAFWFTTPGLRPVVQPCDTVTHKSARRQGLFEKLTRLCLDQCTPEWIVMNFPNNSSRPGYLKLGWNIFSAQKKVLTFGFSFKKLVGVEKFIEEAGSNLPGPLVDYLTWRFHQHPHYSYRLGWSGERIVVKRGMQYAYFSPRPATRLNASRLLPSGFGVAYSHKWRGGLLVHFHGVAAVFRSQSTIAYYPSELIDDVSEVLSQFDGGFLMDTF